MFRKLSGCSSNLALLAIVAFCGCQPGTGASTPGDGHAGEHDEHGHGHDHPHEHSMGEQTFQSAVKSLREIEQKIRTAMESDKAGDAHDPLHEVGHLLEALPDLAADSELTESDWNDVKQQVEKLLKAFGDIDDAFHTKNGDREGAYEAVKDSIAAGVSALEEKAAMLGGDESSAEPDGSSEPDIK